jgi:hypothetical protein
MLLTEIVKKGVLKYTHHYMQTMSGGEQSENWLKTPKVLITLAKKSSNAKVVTYNDGSLSIFLNNKPWATEQPLSERCTIKRLDHEIWQYCRLAMNMDGDTHQKMG